MKKHIILIITLFTINFANGQLPLNYIFSNRDDVSYKGADSGIKAYPWNSGILYLGFCYDSLDIKEGFCITFYDILGTKIWSKTYFSDEYIMYQAEDIIALNNYSFYIGGTVYKDTTCQEDRMFAKFDANGDTIYTKIYHDVEQNWVMSLDTFSSDTILMLSAKTPNNPYPYTKTVIFKIDTLGNIVKTHEGPYNLNIPRKILRGPGYFIYVGGTLSTSTTSQYNVKAYYEMYYLDLSNYSLFYPSTTTNEYFAGMFLKDGLLYLARDVTTY
ncbi:MAG: hypothetical protein NTU73_05370, partial [Ignavibacteriae bacterium]|nr:hypothetical protein [Ignavibacteriota bacterium]